MLIHPCLNFSSIFEINTEEWHLLSLHHYPDQHPLALRGEVKRGPGDEGDCVGSGTRVEEPSVSVEEGVDRTTSGSAIV